MDFYSFFLIWLVGRFSADLDKHHLHIYSGCDDEAESGGTSVMLKATLELQLCFIYMHS